MISYENALTILLKNSYQTSTQKVSLRDALGLVLAENLTSGHAVPSFDNSAMDGYAVMYEDVKAASSMNPVRLKIIGQIAAGDIGYHYNPVRGAAIEITTGAPIPLGYDTVVKVEDTVTEFDNNSDVPSIQINQEIKPRQHIREKGQDFLSGARIASVGDVIRPNLIMAMSVLGKSEVMVHKKPSLAMLTTGNEIVSPHQAHLEHGKIRDCNGPYLESLLNQLGFKVQNLGHIQDEPAHFQECLEKADSSTDIDVMISTGAVSKGRWDFVPKVLNTCKATILFHRINIKPAKPILYAQLKNGTHFFGLPGNPISVAVGFRFFVYPLLRACQGLGQENPMMGYLNEPFIKSSNRVDFLKSKVLLDESSRLTVDILTGQESFKVNPILKSNAWTVAHKPTGYRRGDMIKIYPYHTTSWIEMLRGDESEGQSDNLSSVIRCFS